MEFGIVKWFSEPRGFGFILPDSPNAHDMFTHIRDVATGVPLKQGVGRRLRRCGI